MVAKRVVDERTPSAADMDGTVDVGPFLSLPDAGGPSVFGLSRPHPITEKRNTRQTPKRTENKTDNLLTILHSSQ